MVLNKRGFFFVMLSLLLITFFLLTFTFFSVINDRSAVQKRVATLNGFVSALEDDLNRRLFISGFRIIFLFEEEIVQTGDSLDDIDASFTELFYQGTLNGVAHPEVMTGATFDGIEEGLRMKAEKIGANLSLNNPSAVMYQEDPWNVRVNLSADFFVEDLSGLVSWNKTIYAYALIPVEGFGDPVYITNTNSLVFGNITKTPYNDFVSGGDVSNLLSHAMGPYYVNNSDAPSFLQRFEGDFSADANGIESLVNLDTLSSLGIGVQQKSVVDHIYFSANNPCSSIVTPSGMPSWFRLDAGHDEFYEVSGTC